MKALMPLPSFSWGPTQAKRWLQTAVWPALGEGGSGRPAWLPSETRQQLEDRETGEDVLNKRLSRTLKEWIVLVDDCRGLGFSDSGDLNSWREI